ncbi:MAG: putative rane protein [Verrucomicrobiota bacterium]|jgi:putative membrane protein
MRHFLFRWAVTTFAVFVAAPIVGLSYNDSLACLLGASLLLGIVNAFIRPVLLILSAPLILLSLGFFIFILNGLMLLFVGQIVACFKVPGFWSAIFGALIISIVSWLLSAFFRGSDGRVHVLTHHTQMKRVQGRVIDRDER